MQSIDKMNENLKEVDSQFSQEDAVTEEIEWDVATFKRQVGDAIRQAHAKGGDVDLITTEILKLIRATHEVNLGTNPMEFYNITGKILGSFYGNDMVRKIMEKLHGLLNPNTTENF